MHKSWVLTWGWKHLWLKLMFRSSINLLSCERTNYSNSHSYFELWRFFHNSSKLTCTIFQNHWFSGVIRIWWTIYRWKYLSIYFHMKEKKIEFTLVLWVVKIFRSIVKLVLHNLQKNHKTFSPVWPSLSEKENGRNNIF